MNLGYRLDGPPGAPVLVLGPAPGTTTAMWEPQLPADAGRHRRRRPGQPAGTRPGHRVIADAVPGTRYVTLAGVERPTAVGTLLTDHLERA